MAFARTINLTIAQRNDALRARIPLIAEPDLLLITQGVTNFPEQEQTEILRRVKEFNDFDDDNDPWG
jgi:hypothetical protein